MGWKLVCVSFCNGKERMRIREGVSASLARGTSRDGAYLSGEAAAAQFKCMGQAFVRRVVARRRFKPRRLPYKITQHEPPSLFSNVSSAARVAASNTSSTPSPLRLEHSR